MQPLSSVTLITVEGSDDLENPPGISGAVDI
jgi:hypothetical protein